MAVTGASGFMGRHLMAHLRALRHTVVEVSRQARAAMKNTVVVDDCADAQQLVTAFGGARAVIHLAARAHQLDQGDAAEVFHRANVLVIRGVIAACRSAGVQRLVFVSSIGVLGNHSSGHPLTEADPPKPVEPYAVSKLEGEREVSGELGDGPLDYVIVRPPLVYGPGCPGNFALLLKLAARAPIVPLGGVHAPRRFIGVHNLVDALVVAALHPAVSRRTFVLADAHDVDVAQIMRIAVRARGRSVSRVWNVPPTVLSALARISGRRQAFDKLAATLQVDPSAFGAATGWIAPVDPQRGLSEAAIAWGRT